MNLLLLIIATYFVGNLIGYGVHRALHSPRMGRAHADHYYHHWVLYPPDDFLSKEYREPPKEAEQAKYYLLAVGVLFLPLLYFGTWAYVIAFVEAALVLQLNAYVHDSIHVDGHWLERFGVFRRLRAIHFEHHLQDVNYGIFDFTWDLIFRTWKKV